MAPRSQTKRPMSKKRKQLADQPGRQKRKNIPKGDPCPLLNGICNEHDTVRWMEEIKNRKKQGIPDGHTYVRAINSFAFVKKNGELMVAPRAIRKSDPVLLVGWCTPLSGGARRVCRALSGYTPPVENINDTEFSGPVWRMQTEVVTVPVAALFKDELHVLHFQRECTMVESEEPKVTYVLQNPHPSYKALWAETVTAYSERGIDLPQWKDVNLHGPKPDWFNAWAWGMLRLEEGLSVNPSKRPPTRPDLRSQAERDAYEAERAEMSDSDSCEENVDEVGVSDASSIESDDGCEYPTNRRWRGGDPKKWKPPAVPSSTPPVVPFVPPPPPLPVSSTVHVPPPPHTHTTPPTGNSAGQRAPTAASTVRGSTAPALPPTSDTTAIPPMGTSAGITTATATATGHAPPSTRRSTSPAGSDKDAPCSPSGGQPPSPPPRGTPQRNAFIHATRGETSA